jgi:hypothetical protein
MTNEEKEVYITLCGFHNFYITETGKKLYNYEDSRIRVGVYTFEEAYALCMNNMNNKSYDEKINFLLSIKPDLPF